MRRLTGLALALTLALLVSAEARAQDQEQVQHPAVDDVQAWLLLLGLFPIGEQWTLQTEVQPRLNNDLSDVDQVILRGSMGRRLGPRVTLWGGYAYIPRWSAGERFDEQRIWEQLSATFPNLGKWTPSIRIRAEQRFLDDWSDSSHRLRAMGRFVRPIGASPWSLVLWDEYFVNLDDTVGGPPQGFDQNRLYVTALRQLSKTVTLEAGYVWQAQPSTATRGPRHGHTLFAWLTYTQPRR